MPLRDVKLDDKYDLGHSQVFVTGFQALVRLCLMQKELDRRNGLNTAGYVSGHNRYPPWGPRKPSISPPRVFLKKATSAFMAASTRTLRPPRSGARNRRSCAAKASSMGSSPCGMAKAPASTAPATYSVTPILPAHRSMAAYWR